MGNISVREVFAKKEAEEDIRLSAGSIRPMSGRDNRKALWPKSMIFALNTEIRAVMPSGRRKDIL